MGIEGVVLCFILGYTIMVFLVAIFCNCDLWPQKYNDMWCGFLWPIMPFLIIRDFIHKLNLTKQRMDFKILGKAMGYMFMPTLGVLLMLLIGFFDPIAMWNFIKSDNGWAICIRIIIFLAEIILIAIMYDHFREKEILENGKKYVKGKPIKTLSGGCDFDDGSFNGNCKYDDAVEIYPTEDWDIQVIKLIKKVNEKF